MSTVLRTVDLNDKYHPGTDTVYLSGTQALVRLLLLQSAADRASGHQTAGYVSGYPGSPLGGLDHALSGAGEALKAADITFVPGLNEDLAATAVWGTQFVHQEASRRVDGVFSLWYGKGPGLDRSMDPVKHGNYAGSSPRGGVLCVVGDDPGALSSTVAHQSEFNFQAAAIPVLAPSDPAEIIEFGLAGWALSRYAGCWAGLKLVSELVETSTVVQGVTDTFVRPEPDTAPSLRWPEPPLDTERKVLGERLDRVRAFVHANGLDRILGSPEAADLLIVTAGKAYQDLRDALRLLGLDEARLADTGVRILKLGVTWPIEPRRLRGAAQGVREILVVEEKRAFIEPQIARLLYGGDHQPALMGKTDHQGNPLLPENGTLDPVTVARVVASRLSALGMAQASLYNRAEGLGDTRRAATPPAVARMPYFCSGCPHNTSTQVPEGSKAGAGIGCHGMAYWMEDRAIASMSHMGGEGLLWVGLAPFVNERHRFQNMGDGTYAHSGSLCVRAATAAGTNITFKILVNGTVAMTGGQPVMGELGVPELTRALAADGVRRIALVGEDTAGLPVNGLAPGVTRHHRDELEQVQLELRECEGTSALIYVQGCAAETRRQRKRGRAPEPAERVFINPLVCEGCGDCSTQSNCVSVQPLDTPLGRKRRIDQTGCNKDFSCLKGFCPSFVTIEGAAHVESDTSDLDRYLTDLPEPDLPAPQDGAWNILVTGIGGTGIVTLGALLGMAAHLEHKTATVLDVAGLAQKNGPVTSHVRIAGHRNALGASRIPHGSTDLLLATDLVVAVSPPVLPTINRQRTHVVLNDDLTPTAAFISHRDMDFGQSGLTRQLADAASDLASVPSITLANRLLGDAVGANLILLGYAWQRGCVPLTRPSLEEAIRLNGVAVDMNLKAFALGRLLAHAPERLDPPDSAQSRPADGHALAGHEPESVDALIEQRAAFLTDYQNADYARAYCRFVERVAAEEAARVPGQDMLKRTVARALFRLMAYKDEYEVARLWTHPGVERHLAEQFPGARQMRFHLAPPMLARRDPATGRPRKMTFGPWLRPLLKLLARGRVLRGTRLDPFGWTAERRTERALITDYERRMERVLEAVTPETHDLACDIAALPLDIRGFGPVKEASIRNARSKEERLMAELLAGGRPEGQGSATVSDGYVVTSNP